MPTSGNAVRRRAYTLIEVMIAFSLFLLLMLAFYRFFFAEVRAIRSALEHISVNENARLFLTRFGNDVREANRITFPTPVVREAVPKLIPSGEGKVCAFETQQYDFVVKPPDPKFIRTAKVEWHLKKAVDGTFDLHRKTVSEIPPYPGASVPFTATRVICNGIKEMTVFTTQRRPVKFSSFAGLPFKNLLVYEPYEIDGTGPGLIHVRITFIRTGQRPGKADEVAHVIRTSFALRGSLNAVNP